MTERDLLVFAGAFMNYLCLGGTWIPVMTEKGLLGLT